MNNEAKHALNILVEKWSNAHDLDVPEIIACLVCELHLHTATLERTFMLEDEE